MESKEQEKSLEQAVEYVLDFLITQSDFGIAKEQIIALINSKLMEAKIQERKDVLEELKLLLKKEFWYRKPASIKIIDNLLKESEGK